MSKRNLEGIVAPRPWRENRPLGLSARRGRVGRRTSGASSVPSSVRPMGRASRIGDAGSCDGRAGAGRGRAWVTLLDREIVEAVSIAAVTAAIVVAGRREERSSSVPGHGGGRSRLATASALGVVALVAAVGVVAAFGPHRARGAEAVPLAGAVPDQLAVPALDREGTALHIHAHLDVFVHGRRVAVPAGIGIGPDFISPLHTHDASGVVHVESPDVRAFTLGEVFGVWGVRLTPRCLGGYCASGADRLRVYVGGRELTGDPRLLHLAPHSEIVVAFGTPWQLPRPLPSRFAFAPGL